MLSWKYNPENYNADGNSYQLVPPGQYRVRIEDAEETISKASGKDMIKLTLKVSGYEGHIWYYQVLDGSTAEKRRNTDNRLGQIFDSFNIPQGDMNLENWKGKVGAANIKNELDNKETMRAVISWFIQRSKQDELPAWQEHPYSEPQPFDVPF